MIVTHPFLFNAIVVFFIAFTAAWITYVITGQQSLLLKKRIRSLEAENKQLRVRIATLSAQGKQQQPVFTATTAPVISMAPHRINKTN
jgi:hypothetical protein